MVPVVLLDGKTIDTDLIDTVKTNRDFDRPDMAIISLNQSSGDILYRNGQAVQIDLTSKGGTIFTGYLYSVEPAYSGNRRGAVVLRAKDSAFRMNSLISPDSAFLDVIQHMTYRPSRSSATGEPIGWIALDITNSLETDRILYNLNWAKDIRLNGFQTMMEPYFRDGVFAGFIIGVDRRYSRSAGPGLNIRLSSEMKLRRTPPRYDLDNKKGRYA